MTFDPTKGHAALRRGRWSEPGREYFLTICTEERQPGLNNPIVQAAIFAEGENMVADGIWVIRTAVVMPDHVHLFVALGQHLTLGQAIGRLKGKIKMSLLVTDLAWQRGYFDHAIRGGEDWIGIFLYIYLNPYRAKLLPRDERWTGYFCRPEDWAWFSGYLNDERPEPEWLDE